MVEMSRAKAQLITHPVRSRILAAMMGRPLTTQQIADLLPDLPVSSVYRHVRLLAEGGLLEPVEEVRVNGTATRVWAVRREGTRIRKEDTEGAGSAERLQYVTRFTDTLAAMYRTALDRGQGDPDEYPTHALMAPVNLSVSEYREFMDGLQQYLERWKDRLLDGERQRMVFATIMLPDQPDPPREPAGDAAGSPPAPQEKERSR
jgi:hypothetical protein